MKKTVWNVSNMFEFPNRVGRRCMESILTAIPCCSSQECCTSVTASWQCYTTARKVFRLHSAVKYWLADCHSTRCLISKSSSVSIVGELLRAFAGCMLPSFHSESMIPDQGEHLEHPYSKTHRCSFPIIVCLLLLPCSLPWLHSIEIPLLWVPYLNLCERQLPLVFCRFVQRDREVRSWCQT